MTVPRVFMALVVMASACGGARVQPAPFDSHALCASCRMPMSDPTLALQLAAPGEEPAFFDDVVCARQFLQEAAAPAGSVMFVTDHRTRAWVPAAAAVFTRSIASDTPMGSHVIAHADAASRDADPAAAGGRLATANDLFGPQGPPEGR